MRAGLATATSAYRSCVRVQLSTGQAALNAGGGTYTVREGDTLWVIALKQLGSGASYLDILNANYQQIVSAGGIKPGMVLSIPRQSS